MFLKYVKIYHPSLFVIISVCITEIYLNQHSPRVNQHETNYGNIKKQDLDIV